MPIPDLIPETHKELTDEMRHDRALRGLSYALYLAVERLNRFLAATPDREDTIRRIHTAKTQIVDDTDDSPIVDYFSVWSDVADFRITQDGTLLRSDYKKDNLGESKHADARDGVDKSVTVTLDDIDQQYTTVQIQALSNSLAKFLHSSDARL